MTLRCWCLLVLLIEGDTDNCLPLFKAITFTDCMGGRGMPGYIKHAGKVYNTPMSGLIRTMFNVDVAKAYRTDLTSVLTIQRWGNTSLVQFDNRIIGSVDGAGKLSVPMRPTE